MSNPDQRGEAPDSADGNGLSIVELRLQCFDITSEEIAECVGDYLLGHAASVRGVGNDKPVPVALDESDWWFTDTTVDGWHLLWLGDENSALPRYFVLLPFDTTDRPDDEIMEIMLPYMEVDVSRYVCPEGFNALDRRTQRTIEHQAAGILSGLIPD